MASATSQIQQQFASQNALGMFDKHQQQIELSGRQGNHHLIRGTKFAAGQVQLPARKLHQWPRHLPDRGLALPCPAQHGTHPGQQFPGIKRFAQIIIGTHFKTDDPITQLAHGRQHDDRRGVLLTQTLTQHQAVFARQHQVENDQVRWLQRHRRPQ